MSIFRSIALVLLSVVMLACVGQPTTAPSAGASGTALVLREAPANLGCDAIRPPYDSVTFHIDPSADEQVYATADTGRALLAYWSAGFVPGSVEDPVVRDPGGQILARDGDVMFIPPAAWPRLHGYFVCPSANAVYVLITDPE
jgi:hypothetical protein